MMMPSQIVESMLKLQRGYGGTGDKKFRLTLAKHIEQTGYMVEVDEIGNIWASKGVPTSTLFVAHTDTVDNPKATSEKPLTCSPSGVLSLDSNALALMPKNQRPCCLGADDTAGIALMLCLMAEEVKGDYLFTVGEEKGCVGATHIANNSPERLIAYERCIEVDRAGDDEIIVCQSTGKCASNGFAKELSKRIGMKHWASPNGAYTDNAHFAGHINECVNIAAGYNCQHSVRETLDLKYLDGLFLAMVKIDFDTIKPQREKGDSDDSEFFGHDCWSDYYFDGNEGRYSDEQLKKMDFICDNPDIIAALLDEYGIGLEDYME